MDKQNDYRKLAIEIMKTTWDISDVLDGSNNDFSMGEFLALRKIKNECEEFINKFNEYQKSYYGNNKTLSK